MIDRQIAQELKSLSTLQSVVETYEEIAAMRMRKVKTSVLQNRAFLSELNDIFKDVEGSYRTQTQLYKKRNKRINTNSRYGIDKTVSVLLSSNAGLYGDIVRKSMDLFWENVSKDKSDLVLVGKLAKTFIDSKNADIKYEYFDYSDDGLDEENLKKILRHIIRYRGIVIYHGLFKDILVQTAKKSDITKEALMTNDKDTPSSVKKAYIFEPSLEEVLNFFESEIVSSLFEQYVYESSLSKYASRMINLDYAIVNIGHKFKQTNFLRQKNKHKKLNSKQQDVLSGIYLWFNH